MKTILPEALRLTPPPLNVGDTLMRLREQVYEVVGDLSHLGAQFIGAEFELIRETLRWELKHGVWPEEKKGRSCSILWELGSGDSPEEALADFRQKWAKNAEVLALREEGKVAPRWRRASGCGWRRLRPHRRPRPERRPLPMPDRVTFHARLSPAAHRAERKMHHAGRFLDLPVGSRRWRRWNRVVGRNIARLERPVAVECRRVGHFVDEREPRWAAGLVLHPSSFAAS